jgi:hypothetical protein
MVRSAMEGTMLAWIATMALVLSAEADPIAVCAASRADEYEANGWDAHEAYLDCSLEVERGK